MLKLADKGNIVKDGKHKLTIYKAFSQKAGEPAYAYLEDYYGKFYLLHFYSLNLDKKEIKGAFLCLKTQLSSTLFSQNENLLRLFQWKEHKDIEEILKRLTFIDNEEIVRVCSFQFCLFNIYKHFTLIFNSLFEILESSESPQVQDAVYAAYSLKISQFRFEAILFTIGKLTESRSAVNFRPVLDSYILSFYKGAGGHTPLLRCLGASLQQLDSTQAVQAITSSLRVHSVISFC